MIIWSVRVVMIVKCFEQSWAETALYKCYQYYNTLSGFYNIVYFRSVLPDVIDLYMLEKNARHDALFYSFYVFFNKLAVGIALAVSQVALEYVNQVFFQISKLCLKSNLLMYLQ